MAPKTHTDFPILPQELVELVLDEVAGLKSPKTLRACALVSKSFCFPCRKYLYSDILLVVDRHGQARARRLIKTLETFRKGGFTADVRSLTLILDVSSKFYESGPTFGSRALGSRQSQKLKHTGFRTVERLGLRETSLEKLLKLLITSQLTTFGLEARGGFIDWGLHLKGEIRMEAFQSLFTHPSLKSLQISHVSGLDNSFVAEALRSNSLQELALISTSLPISRITLPAVQFTNSHLRRLDIRRTSIREILRTMGYSILSIATPAFRPFVTFTGLQTLVISAHSLDLDLLWKFILGVAGTLETLEIEELYWGCDICLDDLTSLRNLKMVTTTFGSDSDFHTKQAQACYLLSSATSPTRIQHINLHLNVQMRPQISYPRPSAWTELDNILSGRAFVNLNRLDVRLHFVYTASDKESRSFCYMHGSDLLPQVASNPSVEYCLEMWTIYTPLYMPEYLHYSV